MIKKTKIKDLIKKLRQLEKEFGNFNINIYKSECDTSQELDLNEIYFDNIEKDYYIDIAK